MKQSDETKKHRIYTMSVARVYPLYLEKVARKGQNKADVDTIWKVPQN